MPKRLITPEKKFDNFKASCTLQPREAAKEDSMPCTTKCTTKAYWKSRGEGSKSNGGAGGIDGTTIEAVEGYGLERLMDEIGQELLNGRTKQNQ